MKNSFESPEENKKSAPKLSRREFLKRGGSAVALTLLPFSAGFLTETSHAWSKEVKEGDSWLEGLKALRDEVFNSRVESMAVLIQQKDEKILWKRFAQGKLGGLSVPNEILEEEVFSDHEKVQLAHTHPLEGFEEHGMAQSTMKDVRAGERKAPGMPPSIDDILSTISFHSELRDETAQKKFSELVFDPSGVWEYTPDLTHDFPKSFVAYKEKLRARLTILTEDDEILKILIENETIADPNTFLEHLRTKSWKRISPQMQKIVRDIDADKKTLLQTSMSLHETTGLYVKKSLAGEKTDADSLIDAYKKLGIRLSFPSYKDLGVE